LLIYLGICFIYYVLQERFIFVPLNFTETFKPAITSVCEEITFNTPYGGIIHGLLIKKQESRGLIFYLHGNTGNMKRWQFMAEELSDYGYDVFVMDYRGYGHSRGRRSEARMHRDVEFCFDEIVQTLKNKCIIIYGRSLGAAFATRLASRRSADALILETPFYNMHETGKYYLPFLPTKYLLRYRFRSDLYIQNIHYPIHIFHGTSDRVVPHSHAQKLYHIAKQSGRTVWMITINGGKHSNLNSFPLFRKKMEELLR
jgi:alpha-beta hydrolase superfamily lysophospholipase